MKVGVIDPDQLDLRQVPATWFLIIFDRYYPVAGELKRWQKPLFAVIIQFRHFPEQPQRGLMRGQLLNRFHSLQIAFKLLLQSGLIGFFERFHQFIEIVWLFQVFECAESGALHG